MTASVVNDLGNADVTMPEDDVGLWAGARAGDPASFGALFDRHADTVYRYAYVRTSDPTVAEEIVSIVFSEAWRQRDRVELMDRSLRPWLIAVARNTARRHHRKRGLGWAGIAPEPVTEDHAERVVEAIDAPRELDEVLEAIGRLPAASRETLILHVWGGLSHEQIASELGVSIGTVKSRLSRTRSRLGRIGRKPDPGAVFGLRLVPEKGVQDV